MKLNIFSLTLIRPLFVCIICFSCNIYSDAQGNFELSQRWFNESLYNPAAVGNSFTTSFFLHARQQWVGLKGAPSTQAASFDTYVENINSGFGLTFTSDKVGVLSSYNARLAYAYYLPISNNSALSLGLSGGLLSRSRNITGALVADPNDPELAFGNASDVSPSFDFGAEYKGLFKAGVTFRNIGTKEKNNFTKQAFNIWGYISARFNLAPALSLEPLASTHYRDKTMWGEVGTLFYFMKTQSRDKFSDRFWLGGTYHTNQSITILAGANLTPKLRLGYSFSYGFGDILYLSKSGTHELMLAYQFNRIFYKDELCPAYRNTGAVSGRRRR